MGRINVCGNCGKSESLDRDEKGSFKLCSGCKGAYYCSKSCQVTNWPKHQVHCKTQTTDIKAKDLRPFFSLIIGDAEYKALLTQLLTQLPENNYIGISLSEAQIRAPVNLRSYRSAKIVMIELLEENRVELAYDSSHFFQLFLTHGNIDLSAVLSIKRTTDIEMVSVKDAESAFLRFTAEADTPPPCDQPKFAKTFSKPTGSVYYRSKHNGQLYHLLFGVSNTTTEN